MKRLFVLGLWLTQLAVAQFAVSRDGSILDFSSCAGLREEPLTLNPCRTYRHGTEPTVRLEANETLEIGSPYLSADGKVSGFIGRINDRRAIGIYSPEGIESFESNWLAISRNARYVATAFHQSEKLLTVLDRQTGAKHSYPFEQTTIAVGTISDQGDLLFFDRKVLWFIPFGKPPSSLVEGMLLVQA